MVMISSQTRASSTGYHAYPPQSDYNSANKKHTLYATAGTLDPSGKVGTPLKQVSANSMLQGIPLTTKGLIASGALNALASAAKQQQLDNLLADATTGASSTTGGGKTKGNQRYKTELCRPYQENGFCKYGEKCQFAHGENDLRAVPRHPKYKTEKCRTFHTEGFCPYGHRCHFIHNNADGEIPLPDNDSPRQLASPDSGTIGYFNPQLHQPYPTAPPQNFPSNQQAQPTQPAPVGQNRRESYQLPASYYQQQPPQSQQYYSGQRTLQNTTTPVPSQSAQHQNHHHQQKQLSIQAPFSSCGSSIGSAGDSPVPSSNGSTSPSSFNSELDAFHPSPFPTHFNFNNNSGGMSSYQTTPSPTQSTFPTQPIRGDFASDRRSEFVFPPTKHTDTNLRNHEERGGTEVQSDIDLLTSSFESMFGFPNGCSNNSTQRLPVFSRISSATA